MSALGSLSSDEATALVAKFEGCRLMVLGDLMLDEYLWGNIQRVSPEAPVPILNLVRNEHMLGGAGNVVKNLRSLGAEVVVFGVVGEDSTGNHILKELDGLGADLMVVKEEARKSTRKTRLMSMEHERQVFRYDQESCHPLAPATEDTLLRAIEQKMTNVKAVLCSDYLKGMLTTKVLQTTIAVARRSGLPVVINPKDSAPHKYRGASVLIPNTRELELLAGTKVDGTESLTRASLHVLRELDAQSLLVTRGRHGMSLFEFRTGSALRVDIPTVARSVYDVTGAGDTVTSVFTLGIAVGGIPEVAARIANVAAGIVVGKQGTAAVTRNEIISQLGE